MVYRRQDDGDVAALQRGRELLYLDLKRSYGIPFCDSDSDSTVVRHRAGTGVVARFTKPRYLYRWSFDDWAIPDICIRTTVRLPGVNAPVHLHARRFKVGESFVGLTAHCRPQTGQYRFEIYCDFKTTELTHWARFDGFAEGEVHNLELRAAGDLFILLAEDRVVGTVRDKSFGRGYPALEVGNSDVGEEVIIESVGLFEIE